jgi:hypothetical protein
LSVAAVVGPSTSLADDRYWVAGNGSWQASGNWSPAAGGAGGAGQPVNGQSAFITAGANISVTRDNGSTPAYTAPGLALLRIDNSGTNLTQLNLSSSNNAFYSANMNVGFGGRATVFQSAGTNTVSGELTLGSNAGSLGVYGLQAAVLGADVLTVGKGGSGFLNPISGTVTIGARLQVGTTASGNGTVSVDGGTVTAPNIYLGGDAAGAGGTGTVSLNGGTTTVSGTIRIWNGSSSFNLNRGTLNANRLIMPDWLRFRVNAGTLNLAGGDNANPGGLMVGYGTSQATATVNLSAGTLAADYEVIGQNATAVFNQSGGTHTIGAPGLFMGQESTGVGTYNLSGGTLTTVNAFIGSDDITMHGWGTINITGGVMTVTNKLIRGPVNVNGGTLNAYSIDEIDWDYIALKKGTLNLTGGVSSNRGTLHIGSGASPGSGGTAVVNLGSGLLGVGTDEYLGYTTSGAFNQSGGTHTIMGSLAVGRQSGADGVYTMSAGTLSVTGDETVGQTGNGTFNQSGGTHTIVGNLMVSAGSGAASVNLSGGNLDAKNVFIGGGPTSGGSGSGQVVLSGDDTMTVHGAVKVWNSSSAIAINGGALSAASLNLPAGGPATMLTLGGGKWIHSGTSSAMNHDFTVADAGGTIDVSVATTVLTLSGSAVSSVPGTLTKAGPGTLKVTGSLAALAGVTVSAGKYDAAATQTLRKLTVSAGGSAVVSAGVLTVGDGTTAAPLVLGSGTAAGRLDLTTRGMIVDYASGAGNNEAALAGVRAAIINGRGAGAWNGRGITSSGAAANLSKAVGYALASNVPGAVGGSFMGKGGIDESSVLVRYTQIGDANLDGAVGFADLVAVAQHYDATGTGTWWTGDFDYDGNVGFSDLVSVAQHYDQALLGQAIPGAPASFAADWAAALASVPEPSGVAMMAAITALLGARRRRR